MTEQTNAEMIAENRKWVRLHRGNEYQAEAARRMALILDALEALERDFEELTEELIEHEQGHMAECEKARALAAVVGKVRDYLEEGKGAYAPDLLDILTTAPADLLRDVKADVWDEGAGDMAEHLDNGAWWEIQNPYQEEQS